MVAEAAELQAEVEALLKQNDLEAADGLAERANKGCARLEAALTSATRLEERRAPASRAPLPTLPHLVPPRPSSLHLASRRCTSLSSFFPCFASIVTSLR